MAVRLRVHGQMLVTLIILNDVIATPKVDK